MDALFYNICLDLWCNKPIVCLEPILQNRCHTALDAVSLWLALVLEAIA